MMGDGEMGMSLLLVAISWGFPDMGTRDHEQQFVGAFGQKQKGSRSRNIQGVGIREWWPKVAPVKGQS